MYWCACLCAVHAFFFFPTRIQSRSLSLEAAEVKNSGSSSLCSVPSLPFSFKHQLGPGDVKILAVEGRRMVSIAWRFQAHPRQSHSHSWERERSLAEQATNGQLINCLKDYHSDYRQIDPANSVQSTAWNSPQPRTFDLLRCPVMLESDSFTLCFTLWCIDPVAVGFH